MNLFAVQGNIPNNSSQNNCQENTNDFEKFSFDEIEKAIKHSANTSPGIDNIHYIMLFHLPDNAKTYLTNLFNDFVIKNFIPPDWKTQIIVPILKPNKNALDANSYRPIALSSCICKTFERVIKGRLEWLLENESLLGGSQYGFRKGKGTMDYLAKLTNDIHISNSYNKYLLLITTDINKACESINIDILHEKLLHFKVGRSIRNIILELITNRQIFIKANNKLYGPKKNNKGLAQGSLLSPLLFNIYMAQVEKIFTADTHILQYADDISIYTSQNSIDECISKLTREMSKFHQWTSNNHLTLSQDKTASIIFSRHRIPEELTQIKVNDKLLPRKRSIKLLGLHLDEKLMFREHITYTIKRCERGINLLRLLAKTWWGADPQICINIYKSIIRSVIDYGSYIYGQGAKSLMEKLDRMQYAALRVCIGAMRSTPTNALLVETGEPPLSIRRTMLGNNFLLTKIHNDNENIPAQMELLHKLVSTKIYWRKKQNPILVDCLINIKKYENNIIKNSTLPVFKLPQKLIYKKINTYLEENLVNTNIMNVALRNTIFNYKVRLTWPGAKFIYTDGAKIGNLAGCAAFEPTSNTVKYIKLPESTSIFTAELIGIKNAIKIIEDNHIENCVILTDSRSAIEALGKIDSKTNNIILEILEAIEKLENRKYKINIVWMKAHAGIKNNEAVDKFAKQACQFGEEGHKIPASDLRQKLKQIALHQWQLNYTKSLEKKGHKYGSINPKVSTKSWFQKIKQNRKYITNICRIRLGHGRFGQHLNKINIINSPACTCGYEEESLNHIFFECPRY
ncbi:uncharacterized protein LOC113386381 [Ctenocephalides felis]|uniref:uncharacterized protein LOC113386381 n=1 Tax=Ctenocephalides felis TaxID=7515 RepID=UPI000E6E1AC0|nr:uncharacterized protein LOC113386381 [Ctenocephalides felis]